MKKLILIFGGIAVAAMAIFFGIVWFAFSREQSDKNKQRTEAARKARWERKDSSDTSEETDEQKIDAAIQDVKNSLNKELNEN